MTRKKMQSLAIATVTILGLALIAVSGYAQTSDSASTTIRPFHFKASDAQLADLRQRIKATRWPEKELVPDATQGV